MNRLRPLAAGLIAAIASLMLATPALAFCGFYVARADTSLYNQASQVAIARDGDRTVLTMANDYQGDVQDFALVVPVPTVIQQEQVNVAEPTILDRLDAFSAPRLVEYFDDNPCYIPCPECGIDADTLETLQRATEQSGGAFRSPAEALGVTIEASFSAGEYDILILSAEESSGLETWLRQNDYQLPAGAQEVLGAYIRQGMKFFVARVNLEEFDQSGYQRLRPLQIAYESPRFMLPIRLGMVNAQGPQDLLVYLLTPNGQVEITNYRTVEIPSNLDIPLFVNDEFGQFYNETFQHSYDQQGRNVAFLEYAWDLRGCDPCAADPPSVEEMRQAGVFWLPESPEFRNINVFITRLHVRYTRDKFPEDLTFQETNNRRLFQGRYVMNHPFADADEQACLARRLAYWESRSGELDDEDIERVRRWNREEFQDYIVERVPARFERESQNLARLTGRDIDTIRRRISAEVEMPTPAVWRLRYPPTSP
ncbi:MAG: DUF2330 domain-containing protein [Leptolyngbya sp. SIOISBB]|nr:DUF2330 domain-containing protein [Leptolyngbya sp. SIOISBB]